MSRSRSPPAPKTTVKVAVVIGVRTGLVVAPDAMMPVNAPVRVRTTVLPFSTVRVMLCAPAADAMLPWFLIATEKVTVLPFAGLPGVQPTGDAIRSELATGVTTSGEPLEPESRESLADSP